MILGGGLIGVELTADIFCRVLSKSKCEKKLYLISRSRLLNTLPFKAGEYALKWFQRRNVEVLIGDEILDKTETTVRTRNGNILTADLVIDCTGYTNSSFKIKSPTIDSYISPYNSNGLVLIDSNLKVRLIVHF